MIIWRFAEKIFAFKCLEEVERLLGILKAVQTVVTANNLLFIFTTNLFR